MGNSLNLTQLIFTEAVKLVQERGSLTLVDLFDHLLPMIPSVAPELTRERLVEDREKMIKAFGVMADFSITRDYPDYEYDAITRTIRRRNSAYPNPCLDSVAE